MHMNYSVSFFKLAMHTLLEVQTCKRHPAHLQFRLDYVLVVCGARAFSQTAAMNVGQLRSKI